MKKILCICLTFFLLVSSLCCLSGCQQLADALFSGPGKGPLASEYPANFMPKGKQSQTAYADMVYVRPDLEELEQLKAAVCEAAADGNAEITMQCLNSYYYAYDWFFTNYYLADIHYCADLTDSYWEEEYAFCMENSAWLDAELEDLYYTLAASSVCEQLENDYFGEGWFDGYTGENNWDKAFTALLEEEAVLQGRYYELSSIAADYTYGTEGFYEACGDEMVELLVELIGVRQRIAAYWGYSDYPTFATDFYYYRDYAPDQAEAYLADVRQELVPLYVRLNSDPKFQVDYDGSTEKETYAYVQSMAENMGGSVKLAFDRMDKFGLYDIGCGENKYNSSFEIYLTMYEAPFVFMDPTGTRYDQLTFAHEFGHFCNDFAARGSYAGIDVLEVFSQAMEYLSLCYAEGGSRLVKMKMWDSLCMMVEQSAFADFENRMYALEGDELNADNLRALYDEVAREYGFESVSYDDREFITITHFYTNPLYVISYVVSNDSAMQFYQLEQEQSGAGLEVFEDNLKTESYYFLEFLEEAGLESPFVPGRVAALRETFETALE